jgi:hypothetical protein
MGWGGHGGRSCIVIRSVAEPTAASDGRQRTFFSRCQSFWCRPRLSGGVRPSEVFVARKSLEETWRYLESQGEETPRRHDGPCDRRVCT